MMNKTLLEQTLECLMNNDEVKAKELYHQYMMAKIKKIDPDEPVGLDGWIIRKDFMLGIPKGCGLTLERHRNKLKKLAKTWKKASDVAYQDNERTPFEVCRKHIDVWLSAIENYYDTATNYIPIREEI